MMNLLTQNKKEPMNNNRIKEIRLKQNKTQKDLAKLLNVSEQAIAYYEKALREPPLASWLALADYFNVPMSYLTGASNDKIGWEDWENNTGYSKEEILKEISRLEQTDRLNKKDDMRHKISRAVGSLEGNTIDTTRGAISVVGNELIKLKSLVSKAFIDDSSRKDGVIFFNAAEGPNIKKDMDEKTYYKIMDILDNAQHSLYKL